MAGKEIDKRPLFLERFKTCFKYSSSIGESGDPLLRESGVAIVFLIETRGCLGTESMESPTCRACGFTLENFLICLVVFSHLLVQVLLEFVEENLGAHMH